MIDISRAVASITLALVLAQSMPAMAQSRAQIPLITQTNPQITPQFNTPGPQIVPSQPSMAPLPTDPPDALGVR
jgi:hypothetical protein